MKKNTSPLWHNFTLENKREKSWRHRLGQVEPSIETWHVKNSHEDNSKPLFFVDYSTSFRQKKTRNEKMNIGFLLNDKNQEEKEITFDYFSK